MSTTDLFSLPDELLVELATVDLDVWCKLVESIPFFGKAWALNSRQLKWVQRRFPLGVKLVNLYDRKTLETAEDLVKHIKLRDLFNNFAYPSYILRIRLGTRTIAEIPYHIIHSPDASFRLKCENVGSSGEFDYDATCIVVKFSDDLETWKHRYDIHGKLHSMTKLAFVERSTDRRRFTQRIVNRYYIHGIQPEMY
jgi:hypothetical protein